MSEISLLQSERSADEWLTTPMVLSHIAAKAKEHGAYIAKKLPRDLSPLVSVEDILQEAWFEIVRDYRMAEASDLASLNRWMFGVINTTFVDVCRKLRRVRRGGKHHNIADAKRRATSMQRLITNLVSPGKSPSGEVSSQEARHALRLALATLPELEYTAIRLYHLDGESKDVIAKLLKKTPAAVNGLLFRGTRRLRERISSVWGCISDV